MKLVYRPEEIENMKSQVLVRVDKTYRSVPDLLYNLKGKHREAMYAAVQMANEQAEKKFDAIMKDKTIQKRWEALVKVGKAYKKRHEDANARTLKDLEKLMAKWGLSKLEGIYAPAGEGYPATIQWYCIDRLDQHNPFLAKALFELKEETQKALFDLKASLLSIQETGMAKPKPVNFPEPIKAELQKFQNRGLLTAGTKTE